MRFRNCWNLTLLHHPSKRRKPRNFPSRAPVAKRGARRDLKRFQSLAVRSTFRLLGSMSLYASLMPSARQKHGCTSQCVRGVTSFLDIERAPAEETYLYDSAVVRFSPRKPTE